MRLERLHRVVGVEARVFVVESHDKTERDDVVPAAINPRAAIFVAGQWPARGIDHFSGSDASGRQLPKFLHADAVCLRIAVLIESKSSYELLGQRSARPFGENRDLGSKVVTRLKVRFRLILLIQSLVVGTNTDHAVVLNDKFRSGKSGEDGDAGLLDFFSKPL